MTITLQDKAAELLERCDFLTLASVNEEGYPRCCVMVKMKAEGYRTIWFSTGNSGKKTSHFRKTPKASVCYYEENDSVTLVGDIEIVDDMEMKRALWGDWMLDFFKGVDDPEYALLKFTAKEATMWIDSQFETFMNLS